MTRYDLWFHDSLGWFAVRLEEGRLTGICGPLCWHAVLHREFDPSHCEFDEREAAIARARDTPEQFMSLARWVQGGIEYRPRPCLVEVALGCLDEWAFLLRRCLRLR